MRNIIERCYMHYESTFLLEFSKRLMQCSVKPGSVTLVENDDGTRSMFSAISKKLLVTYKKENQVIYKHSYIFGIGITNN